MPTDKEALMNEFMDSDTGELDESQSIESSSGDEQVEKAGISSASGNETSGTDAILAELENHEGDISIDQIRKLAEAAGEKHTDEELEQMWQQAQQAAQQTPKSNRSYKFYRDNDVVESLDGLSAEELLQLQISYKAMGQEQKKNLDELIRVAQFGHFNESRLSQVQNDRNSILKKYQEAETELTESRQQKKLWEYAITQHIQGNSSPLLQLVDAVKAQQSAPPQFSESQGEPQSEAEVQMAAQRVFYEVVEPAAFKLAQSYGANAQEIANVIVALTEQEADFMTAERLQQIIEVELPYMLEQKGYAANGEQRVEKKDEREVELEKLKKENAALKAGQKNTVIKSVKNRKAPPAGGGVVPSAGDTMPEIKDRNSMKEYLRS